MKYGEKQRWAIISALNVAAGKYEEDAKIAGTIRLTEQFNLQAREARELAEEIEASDVIEIS